MKLVCLGAKNPETIRVINAIKKIDFNFDFMGFIDNDPTKAGQDFYGYPIFGGIEKVEQLIKQGASFCNLITGSTRTRYETSKALVQKGAKLVNLIHPNVYPELEMVKIGIGNYIQDHVIIQANVKIGDNSSIHINAMVAHESRIGHSVFIAHGVSISGEVEIGDGVFVGTNATILPKLKIGQWSVIGAGAVVIEDVMPYSIVVGNPAKIIKKSGIPYDDGKII